MYGDVQPFGRKTPRQGETIAFGQVYVKDLIATVTIKMTMFAHIRAKPRRTALQGNLPHQAALHQGGQAIIYRGYRNIRPCPFRPDENFLGRRVVTFVQQNIIDLLPLGREPEPAIGQLLHQRTVGVRTRCPGVSVQPGLSFFIGSQPHQR